MQNQKIQRREPLPKKADLGKERELFKRFKVLKFLGKGSYGSVYKVQRISDGLIYAVKEADVSKMTQAERIDAVNEIRLLASIQHPNIICYNEAFIDGNFLCIIMEYAPRGDIGGYIKKGKQLKREFPEDIVWNFFIQICLGVQVLHDNQVIHRDIKPMNIFVSNHDVVKVGDLGIAKKLKADLAHTQIGTPHYMPPEIWKNRPYSYACDIWSLGCLLYEIMTYKVPFAARSLHELRAKVTTGRFSPLPNGKYSKELTQLCQSMLQINPSKRVRELAVFQLYVPHVPGMLKEYEYSPNQAHLRYRDIYLETSDGLKLHGWIMWDHRRSIHQLKEVPTIVFFQANAGNISHRIPFFAAMINAMDCCIVTISYRGYGPNSGSPSENGLKIDAETVMEFIESVTDVNLDLSRVFLFGRSLGGAVAIDLASKNQTKDEMVPPEQMKELHKLCPSPKKFYSFFEDAHHMNAYDHAPVAYWTAVRDFISACGKKS
eukprot:g8029.t1